MKNGKMTLYLYSDRDSAYYQSEAFSKIIAYGTQNARRCKFRETEKLAIVVENVRSFDEAATILEQIEGQNVK